MNGYPEWTPVSKKPDISNGAKWHLVQTADGRIVSGLWCSSGGWYIDGISVDESVIAWMSLPPAYEPPRFGWHNAKTDPPTSDGDYFVKWAFSDNPADALNGCACFTGGQWDGPGAAATMILWWSHIESVPGGAQ